MALKAQIPLGSHPAESTVCLDASVNTLQDPDDEKRLLVGKPSIPEQTDSCDEKEVRN